VTHDRRPRLIIFAILFVVYHKFTWAGWQWLLESAGRQHGVLGSSDWLTSFVTASDRAIDSWVTEMFTDTDQQVKNRLSQNLEHGLFSAGGSLDFEGSYISQVGFGGWIMTLIPTLIRVDGKLGMFLVFSQVAALNAAIYSFVADVVRRKFGLAVTLVLMFALIQPWFSALNGSPRFLIGLRLIPAIWLASRYWAGQFAAARTIAGVTGFSVLGFLCGYDYATVTTPLVLAVVVCIAVVNQWGTHELFARVWPPILGSLLALPIAIFIHLSQLSVRFGGPSAAWSEINYRLAKRSGLVNDTIDHPLLREALSSSPGKVLDWYLAVPVYLAPAKVWLVSRFSVATLIGICVFILLKSLSSQTETLRDRWIRGLTLAWFVSLLGPLGWFLLARPAAYIHTHTDGVIWFFPTIPLGTFLIAATLMGDGSLRRARDRSVQAVLILVVLAVFGMYVLSLVRSRT
jgi:hypothetical protein